MKYHQQGVGLVEVVVALLLLAIAVLGFSALQLNALKATDESLNRSRAISISKQLSENIRLSKLGNKEFITELNKFSDSATDTVQYCARVTAAGSKFSESSCKSTSCSPTEITELNAWKAASLACAQDIMLNMIECPEMTSINARQCIITSWGDTLPVLSENSKACGNSNGTYKLGSSCLIMEAY